uniref:Uncharacterized protein n=1 Tax=Candidatus Enterococcus clewellii TaxID=1834193 RepID=A0A242K524_9ENTE|nr:hypothetical protein A5888_002732 [Enterococcus sp. 9E7_DIV0242]
MNKIGANSYVIILSFERIIFFIVKIFNLCVTIVVMLDSQQREGESMKDTDFF